MNSEMIYLKIQEHIRQLPMAELQFSTHEERLRSAQVDELIEREVKDLPEELQKRIRDEFHQLGPLERILLDEDITEILINGPFSIWLEKSGQLCVYEDRFYSELSFRNAVERLCEQAGIHITVEHPVADGKWRDFRVSVIGNEITREAIHLSLRRHPKNPWTFDKLAHSGWAAPGDLQLLSQMLQSHKNFLVVGGTGSGKTSVLNACLQQLPANERIAVIEDTPEISLSNSVSLKLLTRQDPQGLLPDVNQAQLVRRSLRLRPDRIVMGEIRGDEAKDFLMALATGHGGSFGTLHASSAAQALIRLEMLIQMGAPQWNLTAIRRLIQLSLDYILVTERNTLGQRRLKGLYRISSLEEYGFLTEQVQSLPLSL